MEATLVVKYAPISPFGPTNVYDDDVVGQLPLTGSRTATCILTVVEEG